MKKIILSLAVILSFGTYTFFLRSGGISAQISKLQPVPIELENNNPSPETSGNKINPPPTGQDNVTRNINCVYIPSDSNNEESYSDDEGKEGEGGHYKCTTIIIKPPSNTPPSTTPSTPVATTPPPPAVKPKTNIKWKDGTYIGDSIDAYYGNVQISATISNDRISSISFLDYPQDRNASLQRSNYAIPKLKSEAISAQSANVNTISGVTYTSEAFIQSLSSALAQAKI